MEAHRHPPVPIYCIPTRCLSWVGNSTAHRQELRIGTWVRDSLAGMLLRVPDLCFFFFFFSKKSQKYRFLREI